MRSKPAEVIVLAIDNRKDVYRVAEKKTEDYRMTSDKFDDVMPKDLGAPPPNKEAKKKRRPSSKKARK